jgi:Bacterial Ig-like domain (group 3)
VRRCITNMTEPTPSSDARTDRERSLTGALSVFRHRSGMLGMVCACVTAAAAVLAPGAVAKGTLDQTTMPPGGYISPVGASPAGVVAQAQAFTAGLSGYLDTVSLSLSGLNSADGRYRVSIEGTTAGVPNGAVLTRSVVDACRVPGPFAAVDVPFSAAPAISAATSYVIVVDPDPGNLPGDSIGWTQGQTPYAAGGTYTKDLGAPSPTWQPSGAGPLSFSTYVSASAPPAQTRDATALTVSGAPDPAKRYHDVTLTAQVTDGDHPAATPTGTVRFVIDGIATSPAALDAGGAAHYTTSWPTAGVHDVGASYCPSSDAFISSDGTGAVTVSAEKTASSTALSVAPDPTVAWQDATFTATVTRGDQAGPPPTGTVQFAEEDGTPIGPPQALDAAGHATVVASAGAGPYLVRARYSGDGLYEPSDATAAQTVTRAATTTTVESSANPADAGAPIDLIVDVSANAPSNGIPTGTVQFTVDGAPIGAPFALDDDGQLAVEARGLSPGTHTLTVHYGGDDDYLTSDAALQQTIRTPPSPPVPTTSTSRPAPASEVTIRPLTSARLLRTLRIPATLRTGRSGTVTLGRASNPPLRSLTVDLTARARHSIRAVAATHVLAHAKLSIPAGASRAIKVRLTRAARESLRRHRRLSVRVVVRATDHTGRSVSATATRTIVPASSGRAQSGRTTGTSTAP